MFDWVQRGAPTTHRYRGYYDAGEGSTSHCEQCNRVIRYCYSVHDRNIKSFVIGTCCFENYDGTKTLIQLQAASVLQKATKAAIIRDTKLYGALTTVRERRKQWIQAKRDADKLIREYKKLHRYSWLPKELFDLRSRLRRMPPQYKRQTNTLNWFEDQTRALVEETIIAGHALITKPCI